jgi:hypothetical protein
MKLFFIMLLLFLCSLESFPQANLIQSIDFDSQQRVVFGLTGFYDSSYVKRYKDGNLESWNLTQLFGLQFHWIATGVDRQDNIWAYINDKLYKYDGFAWGAIDIPGLPGGYKYSDLAIDDQYLWLSNYESGGYNNTGVHRFKLSDSTWTLFNSTNSGYPQSPLNGTIFLKGDSTFIGTDKGLVMVYNNTASVILDTLNSSLGTQALYCFFIDSQENKWLGTYDLGLVKWISDSTFAIYDTSNSNLPNNFVNAIDEDSQGRLWIATDNGFACLENDSIISYSNLTDESIIAIKVDAQDNVWMGEAGTGRLLFFDGNSLNNVTGIDIGNSNLLPDNFLLFQNFPNPFNPSTIIRYQIPDAGFVTLKVYDVLGYEVTTLVNEFKPAGSYELDFDGSNYASGVYFYKIRAEQFSAVKKMILIK